jgi:GntR family transcriptional regulator
MPAPVAVHLAEAPGSPCLRVEYLAYHRGQVMALCTNYLRFPEADAVLRTPLRTHWYQMLDDAGLVVGATDLQIEAMLADDHMAELLSVDVNSAIMGTQQVIRDGDGRPYDFAILRSRGDRLALMARGAGTPRDGAAS